VRSTVAWLLLATYLQQGFGRQRRSQHLQERFAAPLIRL
jgi:hypothetical protein